MSDTRKTIGQQLRELREAKRLPLDTAANRARIGTEQAFNVEAGFASLETAKRYAAGFGKTIRVKAFHPQKGLNAAVMAKRVEMNEHTTQKCIRTLHSIGNAEIGIEILSLESVLFAWSATATLYLA
jgi:hypothetical protein